ncbi:saccharopine dehydrogenase family protein [Kordiimonas sp. SCSIO 12610]|uniref:saccharopine dehydrogenase family protein n=1 Tax=Kordiimonas sp. SCSIO 12610 TaxID=2829597 RepID=UPI00210DC368|nr:saccharopine dehydrogenase C-terminal domain-containing protein [Kordiimonas sp. SCSIO 12610]UTW54740.1 saccharopine dehydrogenase NADP-binding domain-containing protein [Kordiimonas sp. SCSIO 12610]
MTLTELTNGTIYIIGTGEVAKAALYKLVKLYPNQSITVVASNRSGGLNLLAENISNDLGAAHIGFKQIDIYSDAETLTSLIASTAGSIPQVLFNLGSPYLDMILMQIALDTGCHYVDTACFEELNTKGFSYKEQLALAPKFESQGLKAILGAGGSPGITNLLTRFHDEHRPCESVKIFDYNGGSQNKYPWATNFAAEDNLKELDNPAKFLRGGEWIEVPAFSERFHMNDPLKINDTTNVGFNTIYHEEQETINMVFPHIKDIYNYMSFGDDYIKYFKLFRDLGLMGIDPVSDGQGGEIIPIRFLASLMPHPRDVAPLVKGPAGMRVETTGADKNSDTLISVWRMLHENCYEDTKTGAVAWSTGVPACLFMDAMLQFDGAGVFVPENLPNLNFELFTKLSDVYGLEVESFLDNDTKVSL